MDWERNQGNISFHNNLKNYRIFESNSNQAIKRVYDKNFKTHKKNLKKISEEPKDLP